MLFYVTLARLKAPQQTCLCACPNERRLDTPQARLTHQISVTTDAIKTYLLAAKRSWARVASHPRPRTMPHETHVLGFPHVQTSILTARCLSEMNPQARNPTGTSSADSIAFAANPALWF